MTPLLLFVRSRDLRLVLPLGLVLLLVTQLAAGQMFSLLMAPANPARPVPAGEAIPVIAASLTGWACRPLLWQHERLSIRPFPWLSMLAAVVVVAIPVLAAALATPRYPQFGSWPAYVGNVSIIAAVGLLAGVVLPPRTNWTLPLGLYLASVVAQQGWGDQIRSWWPLADPRTSDNRWLVAAGLVLVALAVQAVTRGTTLGAARRAIAED